MIATLKHLLQRLLPNYCLLCKDPTFSLLALCNDCIELLPWRHAIYCQQCALPLATAGICGQCLKQPPAFTQVLAAFSYEAPIDYFIYNLKFQHKLLYASLLGYLLAQYIAENSDELPEVLLPMPLHDKRIRQRGFNQAGEIAKVVARKLNLPFSQDLLVRQKNTAAQTHLKASDRATNMLDAFSVKQAIKHRHVAVVDDVMTTGATLQQLCQILKNEGVERVEAWCVSRV